MTEQRIQQKEALKALMNEARKAPKKSYTVYNYFSGRIFDLGLNWQTGQKALRQLANILKV